MVNLRKITPSYTGDSQHWNGDDINNLVDILQGNSSVDKIPITAIDKGPALQYLRTNTDATALEWTDDPTNNVLYKSLLSTPRRKYGWYNPFSPASGSGICSGLLSYDTVGTGAATNFTYTGGGGGGTIESSRQLTTGATSGNISSIRFNGTFFQRKGNPYFGCRFLVESITGNFRVFMGFTDQSYTAVTSSADPLATHYGIALWLDKAVSSSWKIMRNDGVASSTVSTLSTNQTVDTNKHTVAIVGDETAANWVLTFDGTVATTYTTVIPGSANGLGWSIYIETNDTTSRNLDIISADCEVL